MNPDVERMKVLIRESYPDAFKRLALSTVASYAETVAVNSVALILVCQNRPLSGREIELYAMDISVELMELEGRLLA